VASAPIVPINVAVDFFDYHPRSLEDYGGAVKTKTSARHLVRTRDIMLAVVLVAVFALEVYLGASQAVRIGHTTAPQTEGPQSPECQPW
jgi:hypothetical protein